MRFDEAHSDTLGVLNTIQRLKERLAEARVALATRQRGPFPPPQPVLRHTDGLLPDWDNIMSQESAEPGSSKPQQIKRLEEVLAAP
jgi:hypothetical protein